MGRSIWAAMGGVLASMALASGCTTAEKTASCDVKSIQAMAPADTTIEKAEMVDKPARNCRVDGYVTTTNPGPNKDYFRLQLPEKAAFKNRYYFVGLGGAAGHVPTDSQIPGGNPVSEGFAV